MKLRAVVLTISDSRSAGQAEDRGGPAILEQLPALDAIAVHREIVPDEVERIRATAGAWINRCDVILATGGTGIALRDVTPEALAPLIERALPGFGELMRVAHADKNPLSIVSRSGAGVSGRTLIVWMPGKPTAVTECLTLLAPAIRHACRILRGDTSHPDPA
ncbi:MAG: MogA/MoaB family molybdenum cofactor biosynthesis protein [Planctomycetia bacterium]|nr:MAG: MogA/MoaB family molybdenum cofactor biosynthesis protein [Planctomycetia bacterium]